MSTSDSSPPGSPGPGSSGPDSRADGNLGDAAISPANAQKKKDTQDSFNVSVKKSPWLIFGLLQIPLVIFMVIMLYVMYQSRQGG